MIRIGITSWPRAVPLFDKQEPNDTVPRAYVRAVQRAGGLPILLPMVDEVDALVDAVDGVIVAGGGDVDPDRYGASTRHPETSGVDTERDDFDTALWNRLLETGTPALGICRGLQTLNVVHGGTLHQHVPHPRGEHPVTIEPGSRLWAACGEVDLEVNSLHHQAVDRVGDGLTVTARATDGTVEGLEVDGHPQVIAVQWHPELLRHRPAHASLFADLVRASGSR